MKSAIQNSTLNKRLVLLSAVASIAIPATGLAQDTPPDYRPEKYNPTKYRSAYANSAFEREILPPQQDVTPPNVTPFELKIVSVTGKDGRYRIVLVDKKGKYQVVTDKPDTDGFHYSNVEPAAKIQDFRVEVTNGSQTEWVEFDTKRNMVAAKLPKSTPARPTNTKGRTAVVPNIRKPPPSRAPIPPSKTATATAKAAGAKAVSAIEAANAKAVSAGAEKSKSRSNGRRVVLPPKSR